MATSSTAHPRQPKGQPTGGQFAAKSNPEADIELEPAWPGFTREVWQGKQAGTVWWRDADGKLQDPPDGSPAARRFHPDGTVEWDEHWRAGRLQDPPDGSPAVRRFHPDGTVEREGYYQAGRLQDPPDGSPAGQRFRPDGSVAGESHYQAGQLQDPPDGSPTVRWRRPDGTVAGEWHYQAGCLRGLPGAMGEAQRQEAAMATRHLNLGIPAHEDHDVIAQCVREDELPGDAVFDDVFFDADGTVWDTYQSADGRWWATLVEEDTEPDPCCQ